MEYIILIVGVILLVLAFIFKRKHRRLLSTGRIPDVINANNRAVLSFVLAVFTLIAFIALRQFN